MESLYRFKLPPEESVIQRNRTITTYYAQLYLSEPQLFKWAGMAAFASFHIGEKLKLWNWKTAGIQSIAETCKTKNRRIEDDFQITRIVNNKIFAEIGYTHLAFSQLKYPLFREQLPKAEKDEIILKAFDKLHNAREQLKRDPLTDEVDDLIWEANTDILWHEQSKVVQPLFDRLSTVFAGAMTLIASFDYRANHRNTNWKVTSGFLSYMLFTGFRIIRKNRFIPSITNLDHRWHWISNDLIRKWRKVEINKDLITEELKIFSTLESRSIRMNITENRH